MGLFLVEIEHKQNGLYSVPEKSGRIYEAVWMHKIHGNQEDSNAAGKMA